MQDKIRDFNKTWRLFIAIPQWYSKAKFKAWRADKKQQTVINLLCELYDNINATDWDSETYDTMEYIYDVLKNYVTRDEIPKVID